jgi:hypothetical protein
MGRLHECLRRYRWSDQPARGSQSRSSPEGQQHPRNRFQYGSYRLRGDQWYLAADQAIDSASLDLYIGYQHVVPEIDLIDSARKRVNAPLREYDLLFTGGRIYF